MKFYLTIIVFIVIQSSSYSACTSYGSGNNETICNGGGSNQDYIISTGKSEKYKPLEASIKTKKKTVSCPSGYSLRKNSRNQIWSYTYKGCKSDPIDKNKTKKKGNNKVEFHFKVGRNGFSNVNKCKTDLTVHCAKPRESSSGGIQGKTTNTNFFGTNTLKKKYNSCPLKNRPIHPDDSTTIRCPRNKKLLSYNLNPINCRRSPIKSKSKYSSSGYEGVKVRFKKVENLCPSVRKCHVFATFTCSE